MTSVTHSIQLSDEKAAIEHRLSNITQHALDKARQLGATSAEVAAGIDQGFEVSVRHGDVETIEHQRDNGVDITVYFDQKKGSASTTHLTPSAIDTAVTAACQFAQYAASDPYAGLADKALMQKNALLLDLYHPWDITVDEAIAQALSCERAAFDLDGRITNTDGTSFSTGHDVQLYANTHGFEGICASTYHSLSCMPVGSAKNDMQRDYYYTAARDYHDLEAAQSVGKKAAENTLARLNPQSVPTQKMPVILHAKLAASFIGNLVAAISGGSQYRKASFLLDKLNQPVCAKHINLLEMPHLPKAIGSRAFDSDGVATFKKAFIQEGVLTSYVLGSYSARKLGRQSTANAGGISNLIINHSDVTLADLCQQMGKGLLVTEVIGHGVNIVTGDYSQGAAGFWVENGEIQYPVAQITIAGNLRDLWANIVAIANDVDKRRSIQSGSILFEQMTVAGR